jgi:hypothetical protein
MSKRQALCWAVFCALFGSSNIYFAYRAQAEHRIMHFKGGWYTPEAAYFAGACFIVLGISLVYSALRRRDNI